MRISLYLCWLAHTITHASLLHICSFASLYLSRFCRSAVHAVSFHSSSSALASVDRSKKCIIWTHCWITFTGPMLALLITGMKIIRSVCVKNWKRKVKDDRRILWMLLENVLDSFWAFASLPIPKQCWYLYVISSLFPSSTATFYVHKHTYAKCWKTQIHFVSAFFYDAVNAEMLFLHSLFTLFILKILLDDRLSSEECLRWNWIKLKLNWRKLRKSLQHFFHLSLVRLAFSWPPKFTLHTVQSFIGWEERKFFSSFFLLLPHDNFIHFFTICSAERNLRPVTSGPALMMIVRRVV